MFKEGPKSGVWDQLNMNENGQSLIDYVERFRSHPILKKHGMTQ
jgi:hypothetical protein